MAPRKTATAPDRMVKVSDIVGMDEIARRTGTSSHAVWNWTKRYDFPEEITRVSGKPAYDWAEVSVWEKNWVRSKGGYHTHKAKDAAPAKKTAAKKVAAKKTAPAKKAAVSKAPAKRTVTRSPMARARRSS